MNIRDVQKNIFNQILQVLKARLLFFYIFPAGSSVRGLAMDERKEREEREVQCEDLDSSCWGNNNNQAGWVELGEVVEVEVMEVMEVVVEGDQENDIPVGPIIFRSNKF